MLRPTAIETGPPVFTSVQMRRTVVGVSCKQSAEMPTFRLVSEQHQGRAGHTSNVLEQRFVGQRLLLEGRTKDV
jgi:hypothetical protein